MNQTNCKIALQSKVWITNALFELMQSHDYSTITISQICRKSDLSRKTFYRHFTSKDDILAENFLSLLEEFLSMLPYSEPTGFLNMSSAYFEFWHKNKELLKLLKKSQLLPRIFIQLQAEFPDICKNLERTDTEICHSDALFYANAFALGGLNNMLLSWIENDMNKTPSQLTNDLICFLNSALR